MMIKKQIKILAKASFSRENLDPKKVLRFAPKLKRSELREYIKYLKRQIAENNLYIQVPNLKLIEETKIKKYFSKVFPDKKIIIEENPQLILGLKIIDNDKIYDFNLIDSFQNISEQLEQ